MSLLAGFAAGIKVSDAAVRRCSRRHKPSNSPPRRLPSSRLGCAQTHILWGGAPAVIRPPRTRQREASAHKLRTDGALSSRAFASLRLNACMSMMQTRSAFNRPRGLLMYAFGRTRPGLLGQHNPFGQGTRPPCCYGPCGSPCPWFSECSLMSPRAQPSDIEASGLSVAWRQHDAHATVRGPLAAVVGHLERRLRRHQVAAHLGAMVNCSATWSGTAAHRATSSAMGRGDTRASSRLTQIIDLSYGPQLPWKSCWKKRWSVRSTSPSQSRSKT